MSARLAKTPVKQARLHPRGQLNYHQRCAKRAQCKADWLRELAANWEADTSPLAERYTSDPDYALKNRATAELLEQKVLTHLRVCVLLKDEHDLGFVITRSQRALLEVS